MPKVGEKSHFKRYNEKEKVDARSVVFIFSLIYFQHSVFFGPRTEIVKSPTVILFQEFNIKVEDNWNVTERFRKNDKFPLGDHSKN